MVMVDGRQRGSALPLMAAAVLLVGLVAVGVGRLGAAASERAAARTAADASALAGAAEGAGSARELAAANGGQLVEYRREGDDTRVVVRVGRARAVARARRDDVVAGR